MYRAVATYPDHEWDARSEWVAWTEWARAEGIPVDLVSLSPLPKVVADA